MSPGHLPVLVREVIGILAPREGGIYVDATVGLGGHAEAILSALGPAGRVFGIDRDEAALSKTAERLKDDRLVLKRGAFSEMAMLLSGEGIKEVDGVLFDLGVSMMQLKDHGRGFSFLSDERLDMRMDNRQELTAWDVANTYSERELVRILKEFGEEYMAPRIARAIARARERQDIDTCADLAGIVERAVGRRGRMHPATRTFQAMRIEVNKELDELREGLASSLDILRQGGRLCVIAYHSLEDRIVKNFIRENARSGRLKQLLKKPLIPGAEEVRENPSSRSAKLRGGEKL